MTDIASRAENISKRFRLGMKDQISDSLVGAAMKWARTPLTNLRKLRSLSHFSDSDSPDILWALKDLNLDVRCGEVIGLIGKNGAGKSTLLQILSRITDPSAGQVEIYGRVSSLLEVGTGFHPELTGRENVYLNGTILGMQKREIDRKFDEIVDFAGVSRFIETPVKRYSSGMMVRLAFAVAAHLEPEILIVDEVLAVGDAQFQQKSIGKMQDVAQSSGRTVLFVSHNMGSIERLCERVVVMDEGKSALIDEPKTAMREYLNRCSAAHSGNNIQALPRQGDGQIRFTAFQFRNELNENIQRALSGRDLIFALGYQTKRGSVTGNITVGISVHSLGGEPLFVVFNYHTGKIFSSAGRSGEFTCRIRRLPLNAGRYVVYARVEIDGTVADYPTLPIAYLEVEAGDFYGTGKVTTDRGETFFLVDADWSKIDQPAPSPSSTATVPTST